MKGYLFLVLALLWWPSLAAATQSPTVVILKTDARTEIAAALYAASATQAAAEKIADARIRAQREEIESLRARVIAGEAKLRSELTAAEEKYVAALAARDRAYAQEIAVFRAAVENIAATPEGTAALARFNAGDEIGALAVLDNLRAARDAARKKRTDIESAAEGRRIAMLALEARNRGKLTTAQVIARFEEVTRLDPGVHWDWIELARLYVEAGRLADALRAAQAAADLASSEAEHSASLDGLGDVQRAKGNLPAALASYYISLSITQRLARRDPDNVNWQSNLSLMFEKIGNVLRVQGALPAALESYHASLRVRDRLAQRDPADAGWQRNLAVSHLKIGSVQIEQGDLPAARASYQMSHMIFEHLVRAHPGDMDGRRDLALSYTNIAKIHFSLRNR